MAHAGGAAIALPSVNTASAAPHRQSRALDGRGGPQFLAWACSCRLASIARSACCGIDRPRHRVTPVAPGATVGGGLPCADDVARQRRAEPRGATARECCRTPSVERERMGSIRATRLDASMCPLHALAPEQVGTPGDGSRRVAPSPARYARATVSSRSLEPATLPSPRCRGATRDTRNRSRTVRALAVVDVPTV